MVCQNLPCVGPTANVTEEPEREEKAGPLSLSPVAHRRRLQLHEPLFRSPFRGHQAAPGEEWGGVRLSLPESTQSVCPASPSPGPAPFPSHSQTLHALLCQQLPELLPAQAQPLGLGRRAVGEEVLGAM